VGGGERGKGGEAREEEKVVVPPPNTGLSLLSGLAGAYVIANYQLWGSAMAARAAAAVAIPSATLPLACKWCRRYAVYLYSTAFGALVAGLFCCALEPYFWVIAAAVVASFAWTLARRARRARTSQGLQSPRK
jgi:hypothetical protein